MSPRSPQIPGHLRQFVVEQDYDQYSEIDHAVWRFVALQLLARLQHTAHESYRTGLAATGISCERIPRIDEMNDRLARFGWAAVCVDGFIPPRAFQAFQANRILPIAADIRTAEHLAYTPAPDILHEAAGHAPLLTEPAYARYIEQFGSIAARAFANRHDRALYQAIHTLSEVKEDPASTPSGVRSAERALEQALADLGEPSESARLSRLYWWTAEYGLIGSPTDYRLYGAGLLSSLSESHSCHAPAVRKIPLTPRCVEVDYDITRAQPQLFVARDFEDLQEVLSQVASTLAYRIGGGHALRVALASEELATLELDTGAEVSGRLQHVEGDGEPRWVQFEGRAAITRAGVSLGSLRPPNDFIVPFGATADGVALSALTPDVLCRYLDAGGHLELRLGTGVTLRGRFAGGSQAEGRFIVLEVAHFELETPEGLVYRSQATYPLLLAERPRTARAGAPDGFFPETVAPGVRVPKPRFWTPRERDLLGLYERGLAAWRAPHGEQLAGEMEHIVDALDRSYPDDWLLRWNLLESLVKSGQGPALQGRLHAALEALELRFDGREPITTGLDYIRAIGTTPEPFASTG
jgi:phenylalanine-4-hydroxylase